MDGGRHRGTKAYLSMASSFSSSSFCRSITAMMMFLSSSVRWLRSGRSCIGGGTVGGRGPRGPTAEDILVACPPPPLAAGSHLSDARPAAAPLLPLTAEPSGRRRRRRWRSGEEERRRWRRRRSWGEREPRLSWLFASTQPRMLSLFWSPWRGSGPPAASRSRAWAAGAGGRAWRGGEGWCPAQAIRASPLGARGGGGAGPGVGPGLGRGQPPPRLLPSSAASSLGLREGEGEFGCQLGGVSEASLPGDAAALADRAPSRPVREPLRPLAPTRPLPKSKPRVPRPLPPRSLTCTPQSAIPRYPSPVSHPPSLGPWSMSSSPVFP